MSDIVERLTANLDKYPGFQNMNSEAAAEIERLRARVAELEAQRDRWKAEAMAWREWWCHPDTEVHREHWEMRKKIDAARAANGGGE